MRGTVTGSLYAFEALDYLVNNPTTDMGRFPRTLRGPVCC